MQETSTAPEPSLPAGLPGDWIFPTDLPCPECRYNLRMLRTPRCPECGTIFRWQNLCRVTCPRCDEALTEVDGEACPKCVLPLDWVALLGPIPKERLTQFEYSPYPVRAAARAWLGYVTPVRFWREVRLEFRPVVSRLRRLVLWSVGIGLIGILAAGFVNWSARGALYYPTILLHCSMTYLLPVGTALLLPFIFTPTLRQFRIRRDQLLRLRAYTFSCLAWMGMILLAASAVAETHNRNPAVSPVRRLRSIGLHFMQSDILDPVRWMAWLMGTSRWDWWFLTNLWFNRAIAVAMIMVIPLLWWRFPYVGLHGYLRLDRTNSWFVLISTQAIMGLTLLLALVVLSTL